MQENARISPTSMNSILVILYPIHYLTIVEYWVYIKEKWYHFKPKDYFAWPRIKLRMWRKAKELRRDNRYYSFGNEEEKVHMFLLCAWSLFKLISAMHRFRITAHKELLLNYRPFPHPFIHYSTHWQCFSISPHGCLCSSAFNMVLTKCKVIYRICSSPVVRVMKHSVLSISSCVVTQLLL